MHYRIIVIVTEKLRKCPNYELKFIQYTFEMLDFSITFYWILSVSLLYKLSKIKNEGIYFIFVLFCLTKFTKIIITDFIYYILYIIQHFAIKVFINLLECISVGKLSFHYLFLFENLKNSKTYFFLYFFFNISSIKRKGE